MKDETVVDQTGQEAENLGTTFTPPPTPLPEQGAIPQVEVEPATNAPSYPVDVTPQAEAPTTPVAPEPAPVAPAPLAVDATPAEPAVATPPVVAPAPEPASVFGTAATPLAVTPGGQGGKKKSLIIASVIIGVLVLLGGVSAAAYTLWYQKPEKVLTDALINAALAESVTYSGTMNLANSKTDSPTAADGFKSMKLTVDGKSNRATGELNAKLSVVYGDKTYELSGAGLVDKDVNLYVKVNDVKKLFEQIATETNSSYAEYPSYITKVIEKIDNKWIRFAPEDLKQYDTKYEETQKCVSETMKKLETDKDMSKEIVKVYQDNSFIVVKETLPATDGSLGYVIEGDADKYVAFAKAANKTKLATELQKCDKDIKLSEEKSDVKAADGSDGRLEVWVSRFDHQLTKVVLKGDSDGMAGDITVEPVFNKKVDVTAPTDFVKSSELTEIYQDAMKEYQSSLYGGTSFDAATIDSESSLEL